MRFCFESRKNQNCASSQPESHQRWCIRLEQVGGVYFLRSIETLDGVYTMPLPPSALLMAKSAHVNDISSSGTH